MVKIEPLRDRSVGQFVHHAMRPSVASAPRDVAVTMLREACPDQAITLNLDTRREIHTTSFALLAYRRLRPGGERMFAATLFALTWASWPSLIVYAALSWVTRSASVSATCVLTRTTSGRQPSRCARTASSAGSTASRSSAATSAHRQNASRNDLSGA